MASASSGRLVSVDYEVFGRVQGVFFRKYTQKTANALGLVGWVKNTVNNTVMGTVQGPEENTKTMKEWLAKTGSQHSQIQNCVFRNESVVSTLEYSDFTIDKPHRKKKRQKPA